MTRTQPQRRFNNADRHRLRFEKREGNEAGGKIGGYASVFYDGTPGTEYRVGDWFIERVMPGAFDRAIAEKHDVRCLFNHSSHYVLGRTVSGTCRLSIDATGLAYEADVNGEDPQARSVAAMIRRGDVTGSSFQFMIEKETIDRTGDIPIFEILDVTLLDVAPVTWPAYEAANVEMRSADLEARIARAERGRFVPTPRSVVIAQARALELDAG